ncbi:MAG: HD domain-containing protein [Anaerolinea sp.]|nr:HD domain-containing protein [Anaerolinea sp.]MCC6972394.1 HD domain-containing protein [Anaerolineae bacterium]CAG1000635.1 hypothetical protein ANRL4_03109 [Anaerolineae bacterium]
MSVKPVPSTTPDYGQLLRGLLNHAEAPVFTPFAWREFLETEAITEVFLNQLEAEWLPAPANDQLCQMVSDHVFAHLVGSGMPWQNLWAHVLRVTGVAVALAPEADIDPIHAYLLGILHDIGKLDELKTGIAHQLSGALAVRKMLHNVLEESFVERIANAIGKRSSAQDVYVKVLKDADKLDKIGAAGILRRLTSSWGANHPREALRLIELEMDSFPSMNFPVSKKLAESKKRYGTSFLRQIKHMPLAQLLVK